MHARVAPIRLLRAHPAAPLGPRQHRQLNAALHRIAITQIRITGSPGQVDWVAPDLRRGRGPAAGAVSRVRLSQGRELVTLGHLVGSPSLDRVVLSASSGLDMWFDAAGFRGDLPQVNGTATTILRAFAAVPGNADREDLRRRRAGRVVF
jgi:hypothetical protein